MNLSKQRLDKKLAELELVSGVSEYDIQSQLTQLNGADLEGQPCVEWQYEVLAFSFRENNPTKADRSTYFGPMAVWQTSEGQTVENPDVKQVDKDTISYWDERAQSTNNPILKARYAGLVWDLSETATGIKANHSIARSYCNALLEIVNGRHYEHEVDAIHKLERALSIAISLNDVALTTKAKDTIVQYEEKVGDDSKPGLWGFSFDLLIGNNKVDLAHDEERAIVHSLEQRFERLKNGGDPWACEAAAVRLALYHRSKGNKLDFTNAIQSLGDAFEKAADNAAPLLATSWLEHVHQIYRQYDFKDDAIRVARKIKELGPKVLESMKSTSHTMSIPQDKLDTYLNDMVSGDLEEALARVTMRYIPRRAQIENQLHDLSKRAPLSFHFKKQIMNHQGRIVATVGPLEIDLDGHVVSQMSQNMVVEGIFLKAVLDRIVPTFEISEDKFIQYISQSPVFEKEQEQLLRIGIQSYLTGKFPVTIHLLIPQIEASIRTLAEITGGAVLKLGEAEALT